MNYETIDELQDDFLLAMSMPTIPWFDKVEPDHIFYEDMPVSWNRAKAISINNEYDAECKTLRKKRDEAVNQVIDRIKNYIARDVGCSFSRASLIWSFIYTNYHSSVDDLFDKLEDFNEFFGNYERTD